MRESAMKFSDAQRRRGEEVEQQRQRGWEEPHRQVRRDDGNRGQSTTATDPLKKLGANDLFSSRLLLHTRNLRACRQREKASREEGGNGRRKQDHKQITQVCE